MEFKMRLDTGCEVHDLITRQVVYNLQLSDNVIPQDEAICACLNGEQLISTGKIVLRWKGKRFRKVFETTFYIIDKDVLPWQVILEAKTIHEHGILKFAGFGGYPILPKKTKGVQSKLYVCLSLTDIWNTEEQAKAAARKREHKEEVKANNSKVSADIKAKTQPRKANQRRYQSPDKIVAGGGEENLNS
jgi:hypothetical protein